MLPRSSCRFSSFFFFLLHESANTIFKLTNYFFFDLFCYWCLLLSFKFCSVYFFTQRFLWIFKNFHISVNYLSELNLFVHSSGLLIFLKAAVLNSVSESSFRLITVSCVCSGTLFWILVEVIVSRKLIMLGVQHHLGTEDRYLFQIFIHNLVLCLSSLKF